MLRGGRGRRSRRRARPPRGGTGRRRPRPEPGSRRPGPPGPGRRAAVAAEPLRPAPDALGRLDDGHHEELRRRAGPPGRWPDRSRPIEAPVRSVARRIVSTMRHDGALPWRSCRGHDPGLRYARRALTMASMSEALGTTMRVLTMPNMPLWPSAWGRMWQWNAQIPGVVALIRTSQRSPGLTPRVSHSNDAAPERDPVAGDGLHPDPVEMPRVHHDPLVHEPDAHGLAHRGEHRDRRRKAVPVDREPAELVVRDPGVLAVGLDGSFFGSTMNGPSRPRPTWSVALWWEWYIREPVLLATNS